METSMEKSELLREISIGSRVAEDEGDHLREYFVKTQQWQSIKDGRVDIIYGAKGSGKSAIYSLLTRNSNDFISEQGIVLIPAENPRGEVAFNYLVSDPPSSEEQFRNLWKLYILCLVAKAVEHFSLGDPAERKILAAPLMQAKLLPLKWNLQAILSTVLSYVRSISPEGGVKLDPLTGLPAGFYGKISLREPEAGGGSTNAVSVDALLASYHKLLLRAEFKIWLLLDRLDVAFADSSELERNALRALFRVYLDLLPLSTISLKIFLRNDIWQRIAANGFREASHVTRTATLEWNDDALLNLIVRRFLHNPAILREYTIDKEKVLANLDLQRAFLYRMFPEKVEPGKKRRKTFEWMLSRTADASATNTPRELIHLLQCLIKKQNERLERGQSQLTGDQLFEGVAFKDALPEVSKVRLEQTILAEHPQLKEFIQKLRGGKTAQSVESLAHTWKCDSEKAEKICQSLHHIGFLDIRTNSSTGEINYWVPFLYRPALELVQGSADE